ncbi:MAG: hypothetical protein WBR13_02110 [Allosphingosinicella sp.]
MIFGAGVIGGQAADLLARMNDRYRVVLAARDLEQVKQRANLAITVAMNLGLAPMVEARGSDVFDCDRTTELIAQVDPDLIINATSMQTFWRISLLPPSLFETLNRARIGPWLPNHLATALAVMRAVRLTGMNPTVVNTSFPDAVNPALATIGLAPLVGAGNIANLVPTLSRAASVAIGAPVADLSVKFVGHHYACNAISSHGHPGGAPTALHVRVRSAPADAAIDPAAIFMAVHRDFARVRGIEGQIVAASAAAAMADTLLEDVPRPMHAPGVGGLPGGYPVVVGNRTVTLDLPGSVSREEAVAINLDGQRLEGIECIQPNGVIRFVPEQMEILGTTFGYRCSEMHVEDAKEWADDLQARYYSVAQRMAA